MYSFWLELSGWHSSFLLAWDRNKYHKPTIQLGPTKLKVVSSSRRLQLQRPDVYNVNASRTEPSLPSHNPTLAYLPTTEVLRCHGRAM